MTKEVSELLPVVVASINLTKPAELFIAEKVSICRLTQRYIIVVSK